MELQIVESPSSVNLMDTELVNGDEDEKNKEVDNAKDESVVIIPKSNTSEPVQSSKVPLLSPTSSNPPTRAGRLKARNLLSRGDWGTIRAAQYVH